MSERSERISRLLNSHESRTSYIKAKLGVLVPAQIRALRLASTSPAMPFQRDLATEADMHQSRISMFETPGAANVTLETLSKIAAALNVGVVVKFVPFSEMLRWDNSFSPDNFDVTRLENDSAFLCPSSSTVEANELESSHFEGNKADAEEFSDGSKYRARGLEEVPDPSDLAMSAKVGGGGL